MRVVVADSGPLIIFAKTNTLSLLQSVVEEILVPSEVIRETTRNPGRPGAVAIEAAVKAGQLIRCDEVDITTLPDLQRQLDVGETEAIALALARRVPVLLDERRGRLVARQQGVRVIGSIGILLLAKDQGTLDRILPVIERWQAAGYFVSEALINRALQLAGEYV